MFNSICTINRFNIESLFEKFSEKGGQINEKKNLLFAFNDYNDGICHCSKKCVKTNNSKKNKLLYKCSFCTILFQNKTKYISKNDDKTCITIMGLRNDDQLEIIKNWLINNISENNLSKQKVNICSLEKMMSDINFNFE